MIYNCWYCGHRINERHTVKNSDDIGKYAIWDNKTFCNDFCIQQFKTLKSPPTEKPISDWCESGYPLCDHPEHHYIGWKRARKIGRVRNK